MINRFFLLIYLLLFGSTLFADLNSKIHSYNDYVLFHKNQLEIEIDKIESKLPPSFVKRLTDFEIELLPYDTRGELKAENICRGVRGELARVKGNKLLLHRSIFRALVLGDDNKEIYCLPHRTLYKTAQATIIHELMHLFEKHNSNAFALSRTEPYLHISDFDTKTFGGFESRNKSNKRAIESYELTRPMEHIAVNFEHFILDPNFACRRPNLYEYFTKLFYFYPKKSCSSNRNVYLDYKGYIKKYNLAYDNIMGVDYVVASEGGGVVSSFGHSLLRIRICKKTSNENLNINGKELKIKCDKNETEHLYISYAANVNDFSIDYWKGLVGGYTSILSLLSYGAVEEQYLTTELRDLEIYPLKFSEKQKRLFVDGVLEKYWQYEGEYLFLTNNCATEAHRLLQSVLYFNRVELDEDLIDRPYGILDILADSKLIDNSSKYKISSKKDLYSSALKNLNFQEDMLENYLAMFPLDREKLAQITENTPKSKKYSFKILEELALRRYFFEYAGELSKFVSDKKSLLVDYNESEYSSVLYNFHAKKAYGIPLEGEADFDKEKYAQARQKASEFVDGNLSLFPYSELKINASKRVLNRIK